MLSAQRYWDSMELMDEGAIEKFKGPPEELREKLHLENAVTEEAPPYFIRHTADDWAVPVENTGSAGKEGSFCSSYLS